MSALTTVGIAQLWASAFVADRSLSHWAQTHFNRSFAVQIGADMRRLPSEEDAPYLVLFPDAMQTGPQRSENTHEIGIVAGVLDREIVESNGITCMQGLLRLDELCRMLENAMRMALTKARVQDVSIEYEMLQYPLCQAVVSVTVQESLPVGRR